METEEMKQVNEEILNRWRGTGFLSGLKEGSINEWRCAKSFENSAKRVFELMPEWEKKGIEVNSIAIFAFPFIRRVLCTGKKRLHRILTGEEVCNFLLSVTVDECMSAVKTKVTNKFGKTMIKIVENYIEYEENYAHVKDSSIVDFFDNLKSGQLMHGEVFSAMMKDIFDFEAEMLSASSDIFVERNIKKEKEG